MTVQAFSHRISDTALADLHARLAATRLPLDDANDWSAGTNPTYLRELLDYWRTRFDWRAIEHGLDQLSHYVTTLSGTKIHFIHERGRGPAPLPLLLTHGFPDSFARFVKLIPLLTAPHDSRDAFDVVVPSLPGFGFSGRPNARSDLFHLADRWHELMTDELGYTRFAAHGGDWGSTITEHLARNHPRSVVGIHLTDVPFWHAFRKPRKHTAAEAGYFAQIDRFQAKEGAYAMIQGTRPHTLADGLNDSPAGLAAWMVDFFERWSDCDGVIENSFTKDELLTNIMLHWSRTVADSYSLYSDIMHAGPSRWLVEMVKQWVGAKRVPAAFALFPKDLSSPPREWAERFFDVQRWTAMPRGGHFAALEEPELLADDIRAFFRPLRESFAGAGDRLGR